MTKQEVLECVNAWGNPPGNQQFDINKIFNYFFTNRVCEKTRVYVDFTWWYNPHGPFEGEEKIKNIAEMKKALSLFNE